MRPNRLTAARTAASASARLVTSSLTASRSFDCPKALDTWSLSRPEATTAWPAARAALAKSTPMPRLAPVINQIFLLLMASPLSEWMDLAIPHQWRLEHAVALLPETFYAVRDLGSFLPLVRELCHRQG